MYRTLSRGITLKAPRWLPSLQYYSANNDKLYNQISLYLQQRDQTPSPQPTQTTLRRDLMFFSRTGGVESIASMFNQFLKDTQKPQTYATVGRELSVLLESNLLERTLPHLDVPAAGETLFSSLLQGAERAQQARLFGVIVRPRLGSGQWQPLAAGQLLGRLVSQQLPRRRLAAIMGLAAELPKEFDGLRWDPERQVAVPSTGLDLFLLADIVAGALSHLELDSDIGAGVIETYAIMQRLAASPEAWQEQRLEVLSVLFAGVPLARGRRDKHLMEHLCHKFQSKITVPEVLHF